MKTIYRETYGSPDVLQLREVDTPRPKDKEVLIQIKGIAVNPADWHRLRGKIFVVRLSEGLFRPKVKILGSDISGVITEVGKEVKDFKVGDEVFGELPKGGFAEYACCKEAKIALKPANLSHEEAASLGVAGICALQAIRDTGKVKAGDKVLINGASGGVGSFAVQIANYYGAEVTAICSTRNIEWVKALGADRCIDYTQESFTQDKEAYNVVLDVVGNLSIADLKRILKPKGRAALVGITTGGRLFRSILGGAIHSVFSSKKIKPSATNSNRADLQVLREMVESGKLSPVIDQRFTFEDIPDALRYIGTKRAQGKVVIELAKGGRKSSD